LFCGSTDLQKLPDGYDIIDFISANEKEPTVILQVVGKQA